MTEKEKRTILDMRAAGKQYKEISAELGIEVSAPKVFVHRQKHNDVRRCEQCKKLPPKDARKTGSIIKVGVKGRRKTSSHEQVSFSGNVFTHGV